MTPPTEIVRFLLVDDLEENLLALEALLRREGLVCLKARSGPDALELLLREEVALALVDVQMPGMDGFELAELMRGTERTRRVPIIFLTAGNADQQRRFRGYEAGAVDFLHKPLEPDVLRSKADVFFNLFQHQLEIARQRDELHVATAEIARLLAESRSTAEALRDADRRKDEFLATLAHELRNPLAPIRNGLHLMLTAGDNPAIIASSRAMMERQVNQLVRLVDDLLDISRVSTGKIQLRPERMPIRTAIDAAIETSRPAIERARHHLETQYPAKEIWVVADQVRLAQVIANLLTNAAKYTPDGGRITISVGAEDGEAMIRVVDSGIGIPGDMLPRVFDLFAQIGGHLERSQGGLGIGLALARSLVEMHGGRITAESSGPGQGSTFTVRIPMCHPPHGTTGQSGSASPCPGEKECLKILVVDDNADGAESLATLLALGGHAAKVAHSGAEALETAREFRPDYVLLDIGLPDMSGYHVAEQLRSDERTRGSVLFAVTGWGSEEDRRRASSAGFSHHLTKPVDPAELDRLLTSPHR